MQHENLVLGPNARGFAVHWNIGFRINWSQEPIVSEKWKIQAINCHGFQEDLNMFNVLPSGTQFLFFIIVMFY